jgi:site-specific DNA-methyltransferase (adenine-specific)
MPIRKELQPVMSTGKSDWGTPQWLYDELDAEFHFTLDVAANDSNAKAPSYFTEEENGLVQDWTKDVCFLNPPYGGMETGKWVEKAYRDSCLGATVVVLIPARTDTTWWHEYTLRKAEIRFIKGRLRFGGGPQSSWGAPFPSAVLVFRPGGTCRLGPAIDARRHK